MYHPRAKMESFIVVYIICLVVFMVLTAYNASLRGTYVRSAVSRPYISFFRILDRMMQYAVRGTRWNWSGVTGMVRDLQGHRS